MADQSKPEKPEGLPPHLFVRNLARDPESRVARRLRPGNSLGFLMDDGRRIRRAGVRPTQLDMKDVIKHAAELAEGVQYRYIEVTDPQGRVVPAEALLSLTGRLMPAEKPKEAPPPPPAPEEAAPSMTQVISEPKFEAVLMSTGENKVLIAKEVRNITGLHLSDVQSIIDRPPSVVKSDLSSEEAQQVKSALEAAGAMVVVQSAGSALPDPLPEPPPPMPEPDLGEPDPESDSDEPQKEVTKVGRPSTGKRKR